MGLYKRGDLWWFSYMVAGRQVRESSGSRNKRFAQRLLEKRKTEVLENRWYLPRSNAPRLDEWLQGIVDGVENPGTRSRYDASRKNLVAFFGSIKLNEVTPERIEDFREARLKIGLKLKQDQAPGKTVGRATVNRDTAFLRKALRKAVSARFLAANPCNQIEFFKEKPSRRKARVLTYAEELRLLSFCGPLLRIFLIVLIETALRAKKEALPLLWADVHEDAEEPYIEVKDSKTDAGIRRVWLTSHCANELRQWKAFLGPGYSAYVFPAVRDPRKHWSEYQSAWERAAEKANLIGHRVYDLRATFASRANAAKATALTIASFIGHESTTILPTYVKPLDENTKAILRAIDADRATQTKDQAPVN